MFSKIDEWWKKSILYYFSCLIIVAAIRSSQCWKHFYPLSRAFLYPCPNTMICWSTVARLISVSALRPASCSTWMDRMIALHTRKKNITKNQYRLNCWKVSIDNRVLFLTLLYLTYKLFCSMHQTHRKEKGAESSMAPCAFLTCTELWRSLLAVVAVEGFVVILVMYSTVHKRVK